MQLALIGLPQAGKSTLFEALIGRQVDQEHRSDRGGARGIFEVPDPRLDRLAAAFPAPRLTPVRIEIADLPTSQARTADALILVVRAFDQPTVPHPAGRIDPAADLDTIWTDLVVADLLSAEKRLERLQALIAKGGADPGQEVEAEGLRRVVAELSSGNSADRAQLTGEQQQQLRGFGFFTAKPRVVVINTGEEPLPAEPDPGSRAWARAHEAAVLALCADLAAELGRLRPEEAAEFEPLYGPHAPDAGQVIRGAYGALDLITFYTTTGEKETRAWTLPRGGTALDAAGTIHSDMARGFIRAEAIAVEELIAAGSWAVARKAGLVRQEGKAYPVADGEVLNIRFAV